MDSSKLDVGFVKSLYHSYGAVTFFDYFLHLIDSFIDFSIVFQRLYKEHSRLVRVKCRVKLFDLPEIFFGLIELIFSEKRCSSPVMP